LSLSGRAIAIVAFTVAAIAAFFFLTTPVAQDPAYHQFADSRSLLGIDNFCNVMSNLPFLIVGLWGILHVFFHGHATCLPGLQLAYIVFFSGVLLTAFGSGYYHLDPSNDPLVWDRLPMTIGFAGLFSIILGEFVTARIGRAVLIPLLFIGIASVEYWAYTEAQGMGDLRPYAVVQFLPMLLIPVILLLCKAKIGAAKYYWVMLLFYVLAKLFEFFDAQLFALGGIISGHSLKHLFAAMAPATVLYALLARRNGIDAAQHD
jgi:hypothetical protein